MQNNTYFTMMPFLIFLPLSLVDNEKSNSVSKKATEIDLSYLDDFIFDFFDASFFSLLGLGLFIFFLMKFIDFVMSETKTKKKPLKKKAVSIPDIQKPLMSQDKINKIVQSTKNLNKKFQKNYPDEKIKKEIPKKECDLIFLEDLHGLSHEEKIQKIAQKTKRINMLYRTTSLNNKN